MGKYSPSDRKSLYEFNEKKSIYSCKKSKIGKNFEKIFIKIDFLDLIFGFSYSLNINEIEIFYFFIENYYSCKKEYKKKRFRKIQDIFFSIRFLRLEILKKIFKIINGLNIKKETSKRKNSKKFIKF